VAFSNSVRSGVLTAVHIEITAVCGGMGKSTSVSRKPSATSNFRVEDGDNTLYRNVGAYLTTYMVSDPKIKQ
jgi:hypothetical protein